MIFETNTQKAGITSAGGDGSGERADRRDQPVVYFVLPCYNEAEGLVPVSYTHLTLPTKLPV